MHAILLVLSGCGSNVCDEYESGRLAHEGSAYVPLLKKPIFDFVNSLELLVFYFYSWGQNVLDKFKIWSTLSDVPFIRVLLLIIFISDSLCSGELLRLI